ncbi:MAG: hypothetical protein KGJ62_06540 [Armatimonadetes bacterium]|nr:hypothetical protein [Armatimonadota bacterium]MDE2207264.1 hypothetical protein [Armatimonadota bacterium]
MANRFEHGSQEDQNAWGNYASQPVYGLGAAANSEHALSLCLRVSELLPALAEQDQQIRPEMRSALLGHLAVCPACTLEFNEINRVIHLLSSVSPLPTPTDFASIVSAHIRSEFGPMGGATHPWSGLPSGAAYTSVAAKLVARLAGALKKAGRQRP